MLLGAATLTSPTTVRVGDDEHEARFILLATGSRPATPPIDGLAEAGFLTSERIFELDRAPAEPRDDRRRPDLDRARAGARRASA